MGSRHARLLSKCVTRPSEEERGVQESRRFLNTRDVLMVRYSVCNQLERRFRPRAIDECRECWERGVLLKYQMQYLRTKARPTSQYTAAIVFPIVFTLAVLMTLPIGITYSVPNTTSTIKTLSEICEATEPHRCFSNYHVLEEMQVLGQQ